MIIGKSVRYTTPHHPAPPAPNTPLSGNGAPALFFKPCDHFAAEVVRQAEGFLVAGVAGRAVDG